MSENVFNAKVQAEEARQLADAEKRREEYAAKIAADTAATAHSRDSGGQKLFDIKAESDGLSAGVLPEVVWGEEAGRLCKDFIDFASKYDFEQAVHFNDERIRGYGVGGYPSLSRSVFLCEDSRLRVSEQIPAGHFDTWPFGRPSFLYDLPRSDNNRIYIPSVGYYKYSVGSSGGSPYVWYDRNGQVPEGSISNGNRDMYTRGRNISYRTSEYVDFEERVLDDVLTVHAFIVSGTVRLDEYIDDPNGLPRGHPRDLGSIKGDLYPVRAIDFR